MWSWKEHTDFPRYSHFGKSGLLSLTHFQYNMMFWSWLQTVLDVMTVTYHLSYNVTSWFQPDRACLLFPAHFPSQTRPEVVWLALVGLLLGLALSLAIQRSCFGFGPLRRAAMGRILYVHGSVVFSEGNVWVGKMRIVV